MSTAYVSAVTATGIPLYVPVSSECDFAFLFAQSTSPLAAPLMLTADRGAFQRAAHRRLDVGLHAAGGHPGLGRQRAVDDFPGGNLGLLAAAASDHGQKAQQDHREQYRYASSLCHFPFL